jgi:acetyl-CoA carboxylase carboxyltransferase component
VGYDVRHVIADLADDGDLLELGTGFGQAIVCGLGRLGGHPVGVVANQPCHLAGAIDIESSQKAARFVQWCDAFGLPLLTLVDTPGYLPGRDLEWGGMIRHGGQLAFAYAAASVPRLCVIMRKAYGGAFIVMDCKAMGNDLCLAWPRAEIAVMGAAGAIQVTEARRLTALPAGEAQLERSRLEAEYAERHLHPHEAARRGYVDAIIDPADTRAVLARALPSMLGKRAEPIRRKHRNGPL